MEDGENAGADHGEDRHRLGEAVDAGPPLLPEEEEDGRDQRAGVTDADPEHEVDDGEAPGHRDVVAPDADAGGDQVADQERRRRRSRPRTIAKATYQASGGLFARRIRQTVSVTETKSWLPTDQRRPACGYGSS